MSSPPMSSHKKQNSRYESSDTRTRYQALQLEEERVRQNERELEMMKMEASCSDKYDGKHNLGASSVQIVNMNLRDKEKT